MSILTDYSKLSGLYYRYKNTSDESIKTLLKKVKVVVKRDDSYYALSYDAIQKLSEKPRKLSLSFDMFKEFDQLKLNLEHVSTVTYLVKCNSRFFLKPDIGEIIDQIPYHDRIRCNFDAICYEPTNYQLLDDTDGEHFIMNAYLLKNTDATIDTIEDLH